MLRAEVEVTVQVVTVQVLVVVWVAQNLMEEAEQHLSSLQLVRSEVAEEELRVRMETVILLP